MRTRIDSTTLRRMWPHAPSALVEGVANQSTQVFSRYGINTPLRVAHFMAQISHESGGGTIAAENLSYTTPQRIAAVWPSRFTVETAQAYVRKPKLLADKVYNGRMGNRPNSDDGYNFRGRGLLQLTGRVSYQRIGQLTGLDLVNQPDMVCSAASALEVAACEFKDLKCLPACDADNLTLVTRRVNGGTIGLASRKQWLAKWKQALPDLPGDTNDVENNEVDPRSSEPEVQPMSTSKIGTGQIVSGTIAAGGALDQINDAASKATAAKDAAHDLGIMDTVTQLIHQPLFWAFVAVAVIAVTTWYWRRQHAQAGV